MTSNYLLQGQTTKYTYKFDVVGNLYSELFKKQYMTNIQDPTGQSNNLYNAYSKNGFLNEELTFIIPIYKNMPAYNKLPSTQEGSNLYYISSNYTSVYLRAEPNGVAITPLLKDTIVNVLRLGVSGYGEVEAEGLIGYIPEQYLTKLNTKVDTYRIPSISDLPFYDVDPDSWYYSAVKYNYENGMIKGLDDSRFAPDNKLTRSMLVTILHRMENNPKITTSSKFTDVQDTSKWYYNAVVWASEKKIVSGYKDGRFGPEDYISRQQLAVILYNYAKYKGKNVAKTADLSKFSDRNKISSWAEKEISWAVAVNVISGNKDGTLKPLGTANRAEAAAMLYKYCKYVK